MCMQLRLAQGCGCRDRNLQPEATEVQALGSDGLQRVVDRAAFRGTEMDACSQRHLDACALVCTM